MEKGEADLAAVIKSRLSQSSASHVLNPTLVRFYWKEMLECVDSIHEKSLFPNFFYPSGSFLANLMWSHSWYSMCRMKGGLYSLF